jgi:hypothetical protein
VNNRAQFRGNRGGGGSSSPGVGGQCPAPRPSPKDVQGLGACFGWTGATGQSTRRELTREIQGSGDALLRRQWEKKWGGRKGRRRQDNSFYNRASEWGRVEGTSVGDGSAREATARVGTGQGTAQWALHRTVTADRASGGVLGPL